MKKTTLAVAVVSAFAFAGAVQAQDYQMEAGANYTDYDFDSSMGVDFTYHLEQVSTSGKPLAEAAFLGRNSNVSASFDTEDKSGADTLAVGGKFWFNDIYANAEVTDSDAGDVLALQAGYMLKDGVLAYVGLEDDDFFDKNAYLAGLKYVAPLGGNYVALNAELTTRDGDNSIYLSGDYYINHGLSVGARLIESDVSGEDTVYGAGARYFVKPNISAEVEYFTQDSEDTIGLRVAARF